MTSTIKPWIARFAPTLEKGDVFATNRLGENPMEVLSEPRLVKNLVGAGRFILLDVRLLATGDEGQMLYRDYSTVHLRHDK